MAFDNYRITIQITKPNVTQNYFAWVMVDAAEGRELAAPKIIEELIDKFDSDRHNLEIQ